MKVIRVTKPADQHHRTPRHSGCFVDLSLYVAVDTAIEAGKRECHSSGQSWMQVHLPVTGDGAAFSGMVVGHSLPGHRGGR